MGVTASVLAIDAGNSKTDAALIGADGSVLASARIPRGFQPPKVGIPAAVDVLAAAVEEALARAAEASGERIDRVEHVSACLANADLPVEEEELTAALHQRGWGRTTRVRNDTFAVLRAGLDEPRGVAVVCGAGINCVGMLPDGRTARFPAIGKISGDWGGGGGLSDEALWYAARSEDGRGERTELARTLPEYFGLDSMYALIEALHRGGVPLERKYELTPVLFATGARGDRVAAALVRRLAEEVVAMAAVALTRLELLDEEAPVLLGGSVLTARHPELDAQIAELLAARAPKAVIEVVEAPPVLGAALLGFDHTGAPAEAHARLRSQYLAGRR
ncbi:N-acetylglucosamine kinase [Streptomyces katsurahamanus]|uniref:ATPase n=1 Tax=Streptomyces katsurahamanus TaxID=2577098 RepID=A0ABW9NUI0_9ACTN|nr:BadF/BadG/BcrA/BcrD ATPase family protein [Streptomyces katsurahamanus]MQS36534.1 ATPase [Streptomyces katsurahamanus]